MKKKALLVLVFVLGLFLAACNQAEAEISPTPEPTIAVPTPTLEPPLLTTDWYVCTTIQEGEWAMQALRRESGDEPRQWSRILGQTIEILHAPRNGEDAWIEIFDWTMFIQLDPQTWPGDRICDTIKPRLQLELEPLPENIHRDIPPTPTP